MSREAGVIAIGIWVIILPFLGFPESWRIFLFVLTGMGLIVLGVVMRSRGRSPAAGSMAQHFFVENEPKARMSDVRPAEAGE